MAEPVAALTEWSSLLKPGGYLVMAVPDEAL
jgi:predicted SAM-dependent methyltransferase